MPERFVKQPGGSFEVLGHEDSVAGKLYTRTGHVVTLPRGTFDLQWDGVHFATLIPGAAHGYQGSAAIVERPDGLLVLAFVDADELVYKAFQGSPILVDPRDGSVTRLEFAFATALTVVPGGASVDPWSGDVVPAAEPKAQPASGDGAARAFAVPVAPSGGVRLATASGGCAAGHHSGADGLLAALCLALFAWLRARAGRAPGA